MLKDEIFDRVKTTSTTAGTGDFTVSVNPVARHFPLSQIPVGSVVVLVMAHKTLDEVEEAWCTVLSPTTFSRGTVLKSSSANARVDFSAGEKEVYCTVSAAQFKQLFSASAPVVTDLPTDLSTVKVPVDVAGVPSVVTMATFVAEASTDITALTTITSLAAGDHVLTRRSDNSLAWLIATALGSGGAVDNTAPGVPSAVVADAAKGNIVLTFNEALSGALPAAGVFTLGGANAAGRTVTGVTGGAGTTTLTLAMSSPIAYGDVLSVTYTKGANPLQDAAGNQVVGFTANITNNIAAPAGSPVTGATMTGPTTGAVSVASSNFTIALTPVGGTLSGAVVYTPSDGGAGGTFTPTSRSLTQAAPSGTFTYTSSAAAGVRTISVTNDRGLANPANLTYTSTVAASVYTITLNKPGTGAPNGGAFATTAAFTEGGADDYASPAFNLWIRDQNGNAPPIANVTFAWGLSKDTPPTIGGDGKVVAMPTAGHQGSSTVHDNTSRVATSTGGWVDGQTGNVYYGLFGTSGVLYLWSATKPVTAYLWAFITGQSPQVYDNGIPGGGVGCLIS